MPSRLERSIASFRARVLAEETQATQAVLLAYQPARERLLKRIDALVTALQDHPLTHTEVMQWDRARALFAQMEDEIARLSGITNRQIIDAQGRMVALAGESSKALALAGTTNPVTAATIDTSWNQLKPGDVEALVGWMADGSPLNDTLAKYGTEAGSAIRQALQAAVATSMNPRATAAMLARTVDVEGWKLLRIARHETLSSYRIATNRNYLSNLDILDSWTWISALQSRTCLACLALDGKEFPITEEFQKSHVACRCSSYANIKGEPKVQRPTGQEFFDSLPDATKRTMMPAAAFDDYKAGRVQLSDFAHLKTDPDWGDSYVQASVAQARANAAKRGVRFPKTPAKVTAPAKPPTIPESTVKPAKAQTPTVPPPVDKPLVEIPKSPTTLKPATPATIAAAEAQTIATTATATPAGLSTLRGEFSYDDEFHLANYRSYGYTDNKALRRGSSIYDKEMVSQLDSLIARSTINEDTVVYRGVTGYAIGLPSKSVGMTIMDQGFMSTSVRKEVATKFASESEAGVVVKMLIPKGTTALDAQAYSPNSKEHEVILPRNTKFRVVAYRGDVSPPELDVEIVP